MGGYGTGIDLIGAPDDPDVLARLHRDVWAVVGRRLLALVTSPVGRDVLRDYMELYDEGGEVSGFEDDWAVWPEGMNFSFSDADWGQMYLSLRWLDLALLEQWPAVAAAAAAIGAAAVPPGRTMTGTTPGGGTAVFPVDATPELDTVLAGGADDVFFPYRGGLGWAHRTDDETEAMVDLVPAGDEGEVALAEVSEPDRSRITELIRTGRCACEICETLRAARASASAG